MNDIEDNINVKNNNKECKMNILGIASSDIEKHSLIVVENPLFFVKKKDFIDNSDNNNNNNRNNSGFETKFNRSQILSNIDKEILFQLNKEYTNNKNKLINYVDIWSKYISKSGLLLSGYANLCYRVTQTMFYYQSHYFRNMKDVIPLNISQSISIFLIFKLFPLFMPLWDIYGYAIFPEYIYRVHFSCFPNCWLLYDNVKNEAYLISSKKIKKGEKLTIPMNGFQFSKILGLKNLIKTYGLDKCFCEYCKDRYNYTKSFINKTYDPKYDHIDSISHALKEKHINDTICALQAIIYTHSNLIKNEKGFCSCDICLKSILILGWLYSNNNSTKISEKYFLFASNIMVSDQNHSEYFLPILTVIHKLINNNNNNNKSESSNSFLNWSGFLNLINR